MTQAPSVTAIMQARMGSTRLPGKVLREVAGKTFLQHAFERLQGSKLTTQCVLATTKSTPDDAIGQLAENQGWLLYRGSEDDVLDRYYQAANQWPADIIVRVTSDCPLLDARLIDDVITLVLSDFPNVDYASNTLAPRQYPRGLDVEAFTFRALQQSWQEAVEPQQREHVTPFIYAQSERFQLRSLRATEDHSHHRWTLDTAEDLELLERLLLRHPDPVGWQVILDTMHNQPDWFDLNSGVEQKCR